MEKRSLRSVMLALVLAGGAARAALLVYDGIPLDGYSPYTVGSNLGAQNPLHPSIVGETGTWNNSTTGIKSQSGGLSYPAGIGLTPQAGKAQLLQGNAGVTDRRTSVRLISPAITNSLYLSVLGSFSALTGYTNNCQALMGLCNATAGGNALPAEANAFYVGFIKRDDGTVDAVLKVNASFHVIQANVAGGTHLFAVKFTYNAAGNETLSAAIVTSPEEPGAWPVTVSAAVIDGAMALRSVAIGGHTKTVAGVDFDEWRVGTTYADVLGLSGGGASFAGLAGVQGVTTTGATLTAVIDDAGSPAADLWAFWGETNGGEATAAWSHGTMFGTAADNTPVSFNAFSPALAENRFYYYRVAASNGTGTAWALSSPTYFMTAPVTVTAPATLPENSLTPVAFTLQRPAEATALALSVSYAVSGTAVPGLHIVSNYTGVATFAASAATTTVPIQPLPDWTSSEERTVVVTLLPGPYATSSPNSATVTLTNATLPAAPTNAWMGAVSTLASNPGNWSLGVVPTAEHDVVVTPAYAQRNLDWDVAAPTTVGTWRQPVGCTNTVTFQTTVASPLVVVGSVELLQGTWTHAGPSNAPVAAVAVTVGGDLYLETGAGIDASSKGWANTTGPGYVYGWGSSYAGEGWMGAVTYGSALNPLTYGSGAKGTGGSENLAKYAGGGLVHLVVAGTATLAGGIAANGYGYPNNLGGSSGGTINVTAGQLVGTGALTANGGGDTYAGSGSGGRIRLRVTGSGATFSGFSGPVRTEGGNGGSIPPNYDTGAGASGTVVWQTAADGMAGGRLVIENVGAARDATNGVVRATHLTPTTGAVDDLRAVDCVVRGNARLRVTADTRLKSLAVEQTLSTVPRVFLGGKTLHVQSLTALGVPYAPGSYTVATLPVGVFFETGEIVVGDTAMLLLVR